MNLYKEALLILYKLKGQSNFYISILKKYIKDKEERKTDRVINYIIQQSIEQIRIARRFVSGVVSQTDTTFNNLFQIRRRQFLRSSARNVLREGEASNIPEPVYRSHKPGQLYFSRLDRRHRGGGMIRLAKVLVVELLKRQQSCEYEGYA